METMKNNPPAAIRFTPAQTDAITARGGSLLVSAAAGSGKTRVLVERTVRMITQDNPPINADRLLIMTFTNAAAAKLRGDIAQALAKAIRHPAPGQELARLRRQPVLLQRAAIGTIDSFCLHFVQQHFSLWENIPPDFEIADEAAQERIKEETLSEVLEEAYQDADFRAFADLYGRGRSDDTAAQTVLHLFDFLSSTAKPAATLRAFRDAWQSDAPLAQTACGRYLTGAALRRLAAMRALLAAALRTAQSDDQAAAAFTEVLLEDDRCLALVEDKLRQNQWDKAVAALAEENAGRKAGSIKGGRGGNQAAATAAELRARVKKERETLQTGMLLCNAAEYEADRRKAAPLVAALCRTTGIFSERYFAAKVAEKLLDYADCEHLTLDLLVDDQNRRTPLCKTVSAGFDAVMVDEYQDTNALQDAIYRALANEEGTNLFFVGDIKQSIYRFRQAEPDIFIEKQTGWQPYPPTAPGQSATIALDANFRSAPGVVAGINYLFGEVFSAELGGVRYGPGQRLVAGGDHPETAPYQGLCELDVVPGTAEDDAAAIAERIVTLRGEGFAVRAGSATRPCRWDDFCILLRSRGDFDTYEKALRARGVPVFADTAADLLDAPHVRPFAALLRVIDNPAQDVELAAVLLSPLCAATPDDLVRLRAEQKKGSLYGAVLHTKQPVFAAFCRTLRSYRQLARTLPVDALMEELFARTGYLAAVGAMPDGAPCRDELRGFAAWAAGAGRAGLPALIRAMNAARDHGGLRQNGAGQMRPGCVSIMTVHRSKGLEFPVVFVANTSHTFNNSDITPPVQYHRTLGLGLMLRAPGQPARYKTLPYAAVQQAIKAENKSEEMRVLYVALTRAQDALIITVPMKDPTSGLKKPALFTHAGVTGPETLQTMQSWGEWLLTAALRHPAGGPLWSYVDWLPCGNNATAPLTVKIVAPPEKTAPAPEPPAAPADEPLKAALLESFGWHSPDEPLREIPAKVSVSAVVHAARPTLLQRPAFLQKTGMTGAERGTAIHAFLQNVPFGGPAPDLPAEVERQKKLALLDQALAEKLELAAVAPFFESAVWRRLRHAQTILREEPFITALPAEEVSAAAAGNRARVLVQGIADVVLVFDDHAEILDYKTDKNADPDFYVQEYGAQLRLYRRAFALRLKVPVTKLTIYSFALADEVDIPLHGPLHSPLHGEET